MPWYSTKQILSRSLKRPKSALLPSSSFNIFKVVLLSCKVVQQLYLVLQ